MNMPSVRARNTPKLKTERDLAAAFSYFETPDVLGGEGEFSLVLDAAAARLEAAWRCKTWGAFARLVGLTWADFVREWREEIVEIAGEDQPRAGLAFAFPELWGHYAVVGDIQDPRECAFDFLTANVPGMVLDDPRLEGLLEWGGSSPIGGIDVVTSSNADGFLLLEEVLHGAGFAGLSLKRTENPLAFLEEPGV
jgi:hypothetical protein